MLIKIVETVKLLAPTFGGINLEDIASPNCFTIEERLKKELDIPVFHDDQHGTAIVTLAGLINAFALLIKNESHSRCHQWCWSCGIAIIRFLKQMGVQDMIMCDRKGAIYEGRPEGMNEVKNQIARITNEDQSKRKS